MKGTAAVLRCGLQTPDGGIEEKGCFGQAKWRISIDLYPPI
jgi:hypothetical protein